MKIINIVPGFGGTFYCGNCLRDSVYTKTLSQSGHEAITLPIYLPLTVYACENVNADAPVFYGAVNIYLKQNFRIFKNMPKWLENFFNSPAILKFAASKSGSTRASDLVDMTRSMLMGKDGQQKQELQELINFLKEHEKPDVVHLSNALLLGLAKEIKLQLNIPVVCSLQDEDVWIDPMPEKERDAMWELMAEKAKDVDAFIGVSKHFSEIMKKKMKLTDEQLHTVHVGVDINRYKVHEPEFETPTIGFLSRMNHSNGFDLLIDAFIELKKNSEFKNIKLRVSGGKTADDNAFLNKQYKKLKRNGMLQDLEIREKFHDEALLNFFDGLTMLTVPVRGGEAFGLYQLEALASGIPIVQPEEGAFPEVVKLTQGGETYSPNEASALAAKWEELLSRPDKLKDFSKKGRKAIEEKFNTVVLTSLMIDIYSNLVKQYITNKEQQIH